ncbi:SOS response-associated peptidase [Parahaliea sp. F7430]|uniref:Abasic site processing protein n=1 Tax=Sediminihaliea albiluteola TaxID=2758564 RepID=A0A7W2YKB7_9GAMM|nr:SOS response-associated peptidase [Sediminihaliea albiluteola]MBA6413977.1 SOS response-associated peptidase [Sediminihaliea albiluteola]
MCGRFNITDLPGLQGLLDYLGIDLQLPEPRYNVAPTEDILLLREGRGDLARWWLVPSWAKEVSTNYSMFNARAESLAKSPAFRGPFRRQRGVVPMSSFIEWRVEQGKKQPWVITNEANTIIAAALWDLWEGEDTPLLSCTLVTTEAAEAFRPWHNRMPVMLTREECLRWLDNSQPIEPGDLMLAPVLKEDLQLYPVNRAVGNASNTDPALFKPTEPAIVLKSSQ